MAGYIGSKAVNLSTTGADIAGDADVSGALDVGGAFTSQGIDDNATSTAMTLDASGNVGIGTDSPAELLNLSAGEPVIRFTDSDDTNYHHLFSSSDDFYISADRNNTGSGNLIFRNGGTSERMRLDASGNLIVGETSTSVVGNGTGAYIASNGQLYASSTSSHFFNRKDSAGDIATFRKDGSTVGKIGVASGRLYIANNTGTAGLGFWGGQAIYPSNGDGSYSDNDQDLGIASVRFNDAFITNGVTTGSDGNDKQDIRDLTEAEQRVAVACKGLLKAWRWKSAVEEKGDDARIHCGIIAQDLQAAFAAEGLDAGRYAMFMSNTWWETQTEVPAVEAVAEALDEEGNVVTKAVEAVDAYTRTDTYDTQEEAPEGATERTRLGVRYSELLAFIIGAL
jgi:hypothetical protein